MTRTILTIVAHPDDEILGCGGTVARLIKEGYEAYTLILGEGITSRDKKRDRAIRSKELKELKSQIFKANKIIGVKNLFVYNFPDNRFDTLPLLDIVKVIEEVKARVSPNIIFTHYEGDLNIDHQITYRAVITATRPMHNESVREIYSFETLSSTEWAYPLSFCPDVFWDVAETIDLKLKAISEYKTEIRQYPHSRSLEGIKINAQTWGMKCGMQYAEAFKLVRMVLKAERNQIK